jgi:V/A-type H+-transporting ATPase subunit D
VSAAEPTTRLALLGVRGRLAVALSGARLLRSKREVLAGELFRLLREVTAGRARLEAALREAGRALALSRGLDGEELLESLAASAAREVPVEVETRKVWGVPVHRVSGPRLRREAAARGASPASWGLTAGEAARRHEEALEVLLEIASRELLLQRLGEEIQSTSRRINALEQVLAPRLRAEARRIGSALEERAREELVRRKRFREARRRRS